MPATILVVEDNADARELLAFILKLEGFNVTTAADGRIAIRKIDEYPPDLIVTDINMPNLDGIQMIRILRSRENFRIPILVMSACSEKIVEAAMAAGADASAGKPVQIEMMLKIVRHLLPIATVLFLSFLPHLSGII